MAIEKHVASRAAQVLVTFRWDRTSFFSEKMQNRDLKDKELDRIAAMVVRSASVRENEIETIVGNPELFDQVRARINAGPERISAAFVVLDFIRRNAAAVSGVLLISIAAISFGLFRTAKTPATVPPPVALGNSGEINPSYNKFTEPDNLVEARQIPDVERPRAQKISMDRSATPRVSPQKISGNAKHRVDFYAVSYAGDPNETERGARIIRVEMSRSALFAMGMDIPLENDAEVVKADLLVGNDGVTRAIRVVE
jgi:hypothetical protein